MPASFVRLSGNEEREKVLLTKVLGREDQSIVSETRV